NHGRSIVSKPRPVEEHQFHGWNSTDVCRWADHDRHAGAPADDATKPNQISADDDRPGVRAARRRQHDDDDHRRPADYPGRQPAAHSVWFSADRGVDVWQMSHFSLQMGMAPII